MINEDFTRQQLRLNLGAGHVVSGRIEYESFDETIIQLMLGSKNMSTDVAAISTLTVINKHCERRYQGIASIYADLSECAHPNNEGMLMGYSYIDEEKYITLFENRWESIYGSNLEEYTIAVMRLMEHEYNNEFVKAFEELEHWLEVNNGNLQAQYKAH